MKHSKSLKFVLPILLILLIGIGIFSGCLGSPTTPPTVPGEGSGDEKVLLRVTYKEINLDEGNFSIEICSLNQYGLNASGFNYNYHNSEGVEITELSNFIGIPFDVVPSTLIGTPGSPTEVNNIPLYFNEVENYFIANPDVKQISCTVILIGTDSLGNEITVLIMSNIPIIEQGVEIQEVNAVIQTTPDPSTGEVPFTVSFDAGASTTEDVRGVAKYCWHFGDDSYGTCFDCACTSDLECPMHTYEEPGTYIATLCVWDFNDNLDCAAVVVTVNAIQMNMTITANPATIAPKETSTISAYLTDQYDNPIPDGTKVAFYTTDGTLSAVFADTVGGIATVDLTLNEPVIATVTAVCDDASGSIIVRAVELGITVTANPVTISPGDFSTISAYLVDTFGEPVPDGTTVTFSTSEGTLSSNFAVTTDGIATVELQLSRITTATVTANYGAVSGSTMVTCTDGPIAIIENDTDDQISPIEISANSDCPYTITFNAYNSIPGTAPPLTYQWTMTHPDGTVQDLGTSVVTAPYVFDACGIYVITLTVCDSYDDPCPHCDTATMRIIVTNPEGPTAIITSSEPVVGSTINIIANSDCAYPVTFFGDKSTTTAICGDITDYSWTIVDPNGDTSVDTASGMMMIYSFNECGTYVVVLEVTDGCERTASTFVTVIVSEPEGPTAVITSSEPIVSSTITVTGNSDCPYSITFYGHESSTILECGDITTYTWQIIDPNGVEETGYDTYDTPDGIKMVYNDFDICGVYAVKLTVTDACENTDSEALSVIVQEPDGPTAVITSSEPIVSSVITITADSDCAYPITFYGDESSTSIACGSITGYSWSMIDPDGVPVIGLSTTSSMTYNFNDCGPYALTLTVTDACGDSDSTSLTVIVQCPEGPTAVITGSPGDIEACSGCPYPAVFNGGSSTPGVACGGLTYTWNITGPGSPAFGTTDEQTASYDFEECGTYTVTLVVTDGCNNTDSTSVTFEVTEPANPTAVISGSPGDIEACSGCPYPAVFDGTSSSTNAACGGLTYTWSITGPGSPAFGTTDEQTASYDFEECGTYTVTLVVTDGCNNTDSTSVTFEVTEPANPTAVISGSPGDIEACSGCPYPAVFDGTNSTTNAACGGLTYAWTIAVPTGVTPTEFSPATGQTASYAFEDCGTYTVTLVVTGGCNNTDSTSVTFEVTEPANPTADIANTESSTSPILIQACSGCPYTIGFDGTGSTNNTACGDLTYAWTIIDPTATTTNESTSTINYDFEECGLHTVTLLVTDGCDNTDTEMVSVNVFDTAPPTVVITGSPGDITACSACPYPATFGSTVTGGATCGAITYAWSMTGPGGAAPFSTIDQPTAGYSFVVCGVYVINLDITDGCSKTAHASVTLEVTEPGAPTAVFTYAPITSAGHIDTGEEITFDASTSTSDSFCGIVNYNWVWGDGTLDIDTTNAITTHTFDTAETVNVILTVTDGCGKTNTKSEVIIVGS